MPLQAHCQCAVERVSARRILLGNAAAQHPQASQLLSLANWIAEKTGARVGYLTAAANTVGAQLVGATPIAGGLNAGEMLSDKGLKALLLLNTDPVLDSANAAAAAKALQGAEMVVVMSPFKTGLDYADVLLPTAPFTETSGSFVNAEGRLQSFVGVVKPLAETRPGWKVLRVLANVLGLPGFQQESSEQVRNEALGVDVDLSARLSNAGSAAVQLTSTEAGIERLADVPIYATDALVRNATSLQLTNDARNAPFATLSSALWQQLALGEGANRVLVSQEGAGSAQLNAKLDATLPANVVRVPAGLAETQALGAMFGTLTVAKV